MRTLVVAVLACWGSLALALGDPCKLQGRGMPHPLQEKHACISERAIDQPAALQSTPRGTTSVGYDPWVVQVSGLLAGQAVLAIHAVDSNTVWAVSATGQANRTYIRTTNGGVTWTCDTVHSAPVAYCCRSIFAADANMAWIGMHFHGTSRGGGIFKTTDGGATWQQDPIAFTTPDGFVDFIHFFDSDNGVCVGDPTDGYFEIYTTSNAGASWSRVPKENMPPMLEGEFAVVHYFAAAGDALWFVTGASGAMTGRYFRTTDRGLTWSVYVYPDVYPGWAPSLGFQNESVGLGNGTWGEISKTTDGGTTWTRISSPPHFALNYIEPVPGIPDMYVGPAVWQHPSLEEEYMYGTAYTLDGGDNWTMAREMNGLPTPDFASASAGWSGGFDPDIGKWTTAQGRVIGASMDTLKFRALEVGQRSDTIAVYVVNFGSEQLTVTSIDAPGTNFAVVRQPSLPAVLPPLGSVSVDVSFVPYESATLHDSLVFVSDASNAPRVSVCLEARGVKVQPAESGLMYAASTSLYAVDPTTGTPSIIGPLEGYQFNSMTIHPANGELYGTTIGNSTTLYRICCASGWATPVQAFQVPNMLTVAFSPDGELYGAKGARLYRLDPATGDTLGIGTNPGVAYLSIAFSPSGKLWASVLSSNAGKDGIYTVSTTTGEATLVGTTGDGQNTQSIFFNPQGAMYGLKGVGVDNNTVISIDTVTGAGTTLFSTGLSRIRAMTMMSVDTTASSVSPEEVPLIFVLRQNYPNPFNPSTTIRYGLPTRSHVTLTVFNMLGERVAELVNGEVEAGNHEARFDASGLASGVYMYRLQAGDFVQTKKLILVK